MKKNETFSDIVFKKILEDIEKLEKTNSKITTENNYENKKLQHLLEQKHNIVVKEASYEI